MQLHITDLPGQERDWKIVSRMDTGEYIVLPMSARPYRGDLPGFIMVREYLTKSQADRLCPCYNA